MDKIEAKEEKEDITKELFPSYALYAIKDIMTDHKLTADQALFILCKFCNIEYDVSLNDITSLYNKGLLIKGNNVNATLLFHLKNNEQMTLDLVFNSNPRGTDITLERANRIEKEFVVDIFLTNEEKKYIADKYFKGDMVLARYFIIFKSLFPVKHRVNNSKWNKKFGFIYEGMSLWDDSSRVAKKFIEIYKKLDIGIFLEATYKRVKETIDLEQEKCFMTKPYKHLLSFDSYYRQVEADLKNQKVRSEKDIGLKIDSLKV